MSYCNALPVVESESNILIEACLAGVLRSAGRDDEDVLPPLRELLPASPAPPGPVAPRAIREQPSAETSVSATSPTVRTRRSPPRTLVQSMRWPVFLCGFLGGIFGGAALMKSPAGAHVARALHAAVAP